MSNSAAKAPKWPDVSIALQENRRELVVSNQHDIDPLLYELKQLNFLEISKCTFTELPDGMQNLENLANLSLHHNTLLTVPIGLGSLVNLKFLDISFNAIVNLPATIFDNLAHLQSLVLDSNQLSDLPPLGGLVELHHLSVNNNKLSLLPESFWTCIKLMTADISVNQLIELPSDVSWSSLVHLQQLNLSDNKLSAVPGAISECRKLKELTLSGNPLKDNRLKKLAADARSGPAIMNYISRIAGGGNRGRRDKSAKRGPRVASQSARRNFKPDALPMHQGVQISQNGDSDTYQVRILRSEELRVSLRPRVFCCVVGGVNLQGDGVLADFFRFQIKLHDRLAEQRRAATICTHDFGQVVLPLTFSVQSVDSATIQPLNMAKRKTARQLLIRLGVEAEAERKRRKMTQFSSLSRYLELVSPLLGPGRQNAAAANFADIQPLPVMTDASSTTLSIHPLVCCQQSRLTPGTTSVLLEVAGITDEVCKKIMRALIAWLVQYALAPSETSVEAGGGDAPSPQLTLHPLTIVNAETGDRFASYPSTSDVEAPDFLSVQV